LAAEQSKKRCQGDAPCRGKTAGRRRGARGHRRQRIRPEEPADAAEAGEQFEQPGGAIRSREKGEKERRQGSTYTHRERSKQAGIKAGFNAERDYCTGVIPA
jgi:hypothetical protein